MAGGTAVAHGLFMRTRHLLLLASLVVTSAVGCASSSEDDDAEGGADALTGDTEGAGFVYFHGMSKLGFAKSALTAKTGQAGLLAPQYSDDQIQGPVQQNVLDFLGS